MNLLLFGGSFDPLHRGHLALAAAAVMRLDMHRVIFLPAWQNPLKDKRPQASQAQRLRWLQLATAGIPWATVSEIELQHSKASYSWQSVEWASQQWPQAKLHWLIGSDQWHQLDSWARIEWLDEQLIWVVGARQEQLKQAPSQSGKRRSFWLEDFDHPANSTAIRQQHQTGEQRDHFHQAWLPALIAAEVSDSAVYPGHP